MIYLTRDLMMNEVVESVSDDEFFVLSRDMIIQGMTYFE